MRRPVVNIVSYLSPNLFWFYESVSDYLSRKLRIKTQLVQSPYDPLADSDLLNDHWDMAFICGLPFIRYYQVNPQQLQAIAAPVMQAARYQNQPVYFSDLIVRADSPYITLTDLAGATFCYNDSGSNSGYHLPRYYLLHQGHSPHLFAQAVQSGSHQRSIAWVIAGKADCAAIDSTVLEEELRCLPEIASQLRVIASIGPCPIPPIAVAQRLGEEIRHQIQTALLQPDAILQAAMQRAKIQRFVTVQTEDYSVLATMHNSVLQLEHWHQA